MKIRPAVWVAGGLFAFFMAPLIVPIGGNDPGEPLVGMGLKRRPQTQEEINRGRPPGPLPTDFDVLPQKKPGSKKGWY